MKRVLIFGIGGFVGSYLAAEFQAHGYSVCGCDIRRSNSIPEDVDFYAADLLDAEAVASVVQKAAADLIVNLAAVSSVGLSWKEPWLTMSVNVGGALNLLEAVRACALPPKVVFIGSSEEYAPSEGPLGESALLNANNPYGISKLTQERFAELYRKRYGIKCCCIRPFNHTGIGQRETFVLPDFCRQAAQIERSGRPGVIQVGNLAVRRDFSDVRDVVRAYRMIAESDCADTVYNVGSGTAYELGELLRFIVSLSSQEIRIETDETRLRPADTPVICCDNGRLRRELGWKPEYSIFDTLREMFDYYVRG